MHRLAIPFLVVTTLLTPAPASATVTSVPTAPAATATPAQERSYSDVVPDSATTDDGLLLDYLVSSSAARGIPERLRGVPVRTEVTGRIKRQ